MPLEGESVMQLREEMAIRALNERYTVTEVAKLFGVTRPTVRLWRDRYREQGRAGLSEHSHAPEKCPHRTSREVEELLIAERKKWGWGSKKILKRLEESHPKLELPARSTVDGIFARAGLIKQSPPRRARPETPFRRRYEAHEAGELTTIDHKGWFLLKNGKYCYPLTIVDHVSRYLLACESLDSTSFERAWPVVERVFREHGLPRAMQSDNGPPFGTPHGKFSRLSVELMSLGILPVFGRPGVPQDNGRHERMHRDLKRETTRPPARTWAEQQKKFDEFIHNYNVERPHEGMNMDRPARVYRKSERPSPKRRRAPEYELDWEKRMVDHNGGIRWRQNYIFVSDTLAGRQVALEATGDRLWTVHYYGFELGKLDEIEQKFI